MAIRTFRLGLNKAENDDLVKNLLIQLFNANWDVIDTLAREDDLSDHIDNNTVHVSRDGTLQSGLNAEMVGGMKAEDLAGAEHNHDSRYYQRSEADNKFAIKTSVYTKTEADGRFALADSVYSKGEADTVFAQLNDVYTKTEADGRFALADNVYSKGEADNKFALSAHGHAWQKTINFNNLDFCLNMTVAHTGSPSWVPYQGGYSGLTYTGGNNSSVFCLLPQAATAYSMGLVFALDSSAAGKVQLVCDYADDNNYLTAELNVDTAELRLIRKSDGNATTLHITTLSPLAGRTVNGTDELAQFPSFGPAFVFHLEAAEDTVKIRTGTTNSVAPINPQALTEVATATKLLTAGRFGFGIADGQNITLHHAVLTGI